MTPTTAGQSAEHPPESHLPETLLMTCILGVLAPLLMTGGITDSGLARLAARQAIDAYRAAGQDQLVTIAQLVGFALTALDDLRLSMPAELSLSMKLRLRGNANALNRSSERAATALRQQRGVTKSPVLTRQPAPAADPVPNKPPSQPNPPATTPVPHAQPDTDRQRQLSWASAMTDIAAECRAALPQLPPEQHKTQLLRINALTKTAQSLNRGDASLKSRLLGGTAMRG